MVRLELTRLTAPESKSGTTANFATSALFGGEDGTRTHSRLLAKQVHYQLCYFPSNLAGIVRFELTISESKSDALGQLGDIPTILVDEVGLEPTTYSV